MAGNLSAAERAAWELYKDVSSFLGKTKAGKIAKAAKLLREMRSTLDNAACSNGSIRDPLKIYYP